RLRVLVADALGPGRRAEVQVPPALVPITPVVVGDLRAPVCIDAECKVGTVSDREPGGDRRAVVLPVAEIADPSLQMRIESHELRVEDEVRDAGDGVRAV